MTTAEALPIHCPRCRAPLEAVTALGLDADRCTRCAGIWLDRGKCERASRPTGRMVTALSAAPEKPTPMNTDQRIECPRCRKVCFRERYASSQVEIDRCRCGVWLDPGELERIMNHRKNVLDNMNLRGSERDREAMERDYTRRYFDLM